MVTREDVNYAEEINENLSAEDIRNLYPESLLIWVCGSGCGAGRPFASYSCVLDYKGKTKHLDGEVHAASANAAMIEGFKAAVENVKIPVSILLLTPCPLGFSGGFRGKGPNSAGIQAAVELVKEKGCSLTTSVVTGEVVQKSVASQSGKTLEPRANKYKITIYRECIDKVCRLLLKHGVDQEIIDQVRPIVKNVS